MESERLLIRKMLEADESAFTAGIADKALRDAYGFPREMGAGIPQKIFRHFLGLSRAYAIAEKTTGNMAGFMLDTEPELPAEAAAGLPGKGRTLAYAVFAGYRRRGYMQETLETYIPYLFRTVDYIHCGHFPDNEASRNLLRKLGFREYARHTAGNRMIIDGILLRE